MSELNRQPSVVPKPIKKIPQPVGVDEILNQLRNGTRDTETHDDTQSELQVKSERERSVQLGRNMASNSSFIRKPERTIQLNMNEI